MRKLSNGLDATLINYRKLSAALFGEDHNSVKFIDVKIKAQGENMEVLADERQMIQVLFNMTDGGVENAKKD